MSPRARAAALTARTADRHALYEASVQDVGTDIRFLERVFRAAGRPRPLRLREDFCGTAKLCAAWAASDPARRAIGIDLHRPTMAYGRRVHLSPLGVAAARVDLRQRDVRDGVRERVEVAVAFNFSYCALKQRAEMLQYARAARRGLSPGGAFVLDIHGGTEVFEELEETSAHPGFTYVWQQEPYDAIGGLARRTITFRFPDRTEMRRAFTYDWRLWTLPELTDILDEAGFGRVDVYWEGASADGTGDGVFRRRRRADNEASWIAYVVAWRDGEGA